MLLAGLLGLGGCASNAQLCNQEGFPAGHPQHWQCMHYHVTEDAVAAQNAQAFKAIMPRSCQFSGGTQICY